MILLRVIGAGRSDDASSAGLCGAMEIDASSDGLGHFEIKTKTVAIWVSACDDNGVAVTADTGLQR